MASSCKQAHDGAQMKWQLEPILGRFGQLGFSCCAAKQVRAIGGEKFNTPQGTVWQCNGSRGRAG